MPIQVAFHPKIQFVFHLYWPGDMIEANRLMNQCGY